MDKTYSLDAVKKNFLQVWYGANRQHKINQHQSEPSEYLWQEFIMPEIKSAFQLGYEKGLLDKKIKESNEKTPPPKNDFQAARGGEKNE